mgnify:CR=1 FL=1|jgi:hypothetical protein
MNNEEDSEGGYSDAEVKVPEQNGAEEVDMDEKTQK